VSQPGDAKRGVFSRGGPIAAIDGCAALLVVSAVDGGAFLSTSQPALETGESRQAIYDRMRRDHLMGETITGIGRVRRGDVHRLAAVRHGNGAAAPSTPRTRRAGQRVR
jgi:hypothetical protein